MRPRIQLLGLRGLANRGTERVRGGFFRTHGAARQQKWQGRAKDESYCPPSHLASRALKKPSDFLSAIQLLT